MPDAWKTHEIEQLNGGDRRIKLPAQFQILTESWSGAWTESWNQVAAVPHITYIPERDRVLMLVSCGNPHYAKMLASDDHGATWTEPEGVCTDEASDGEIGFGVGLVYVGNGRVLFWASTYWDADEAKRPWMRFTSDDYGETWTKGAAIPLAKGMPWEPAFVDRDPETGEVTRLFETAYIEDHSREIWSQGYLRHSDDRGETWSNLVAVPQWSATNEVLLIRAKNGDLVAAHRTDMPERFIKRDPETGAEISALDLYEGLGVSISQDDGRTWSGIAKLYAWGRHHFSMVLLPNGDIVMSYASRMGYVETPEGYPQFGVEAVVSHDNGQTWDLDHRYIFAAWPGNRTDEGWSWARCSQKTSSVLLPNGSILTAFGTGFRGDVPEGEEQNFSPRDVGLVKWRPNDNPEALNDDRTIASAPIDSNVRNRFDPEERAGPPSSCR